MHSTSCQTLNAFSFFALSPTYILLFPPPLASYTTPLEISPRLSLYILTLAYNFPSHLR
jgi:hypothetical protein